MDVQAMQMLLIIGLAQETPPTGTQTTGSWGPPPSAHHFAHKGVAWDITENAEEYQIDID